MSRSSVDAVLGWWLIGSAVLSAGVVVLVGGFVVYDAWPAFREVGVSRFVLDDDWGPTRGQFNLWPMCVASLAVMLGGTLLAGPVGVASAIFSVSYAPAWLARGYRVMVELLAGVPSVVFGFWGLVTVVPWINAWHPPGASLLAGVLIVGLMVLPTVMLLSEAALRGVPESYWQGAAALGLGRWATLWRVVLPAAKQGVLTAVLLAAARAVGETMAVLMVCGNVVQLPESVFDPVRTLTANMALEMAYAMPTHRSALAVSGLVLLVLVVGLVGLAEWCSRGKLWQVRAGGAQGNARGDAQHA